MFERKPDWDEAKRVLGDTDFLNKLKTYDKDYIKESVINKIAKYITEPNMQIESRHQSLAGRQRGTSRSTFVRLWSLCCRWRLCFFESALVLLLLLMTLFCSARSSACGSTR